MANDGLGGRQGAVGGTADPGDGGRTPFKSLLGRGVSRWGGWLWLPCSILWMEAAARLATLGPAFDRSILYLVLFSGAYGLAACFLCGLFKKRGPLAGLIFLGVLWIYCGVQMVYYDIFDTFATFFSAAGAGDAMQFGDIILGAVGRMLPWLLLTGAPLPLWGLAWRRGWVRQVRGGRARWTALGLAAALQLSGAVLTLAAAGGPPTDRQLYTDTFLPVASAGRFGFATGARINLREMLLPTAPQLPPLEEGQGPAIEHPGDYHMLDIDFDALLERDQSNPDLRFLHSFFRQEVPTRKNACTGAFAGKNLIVLTCESFSPLAVDPQLTPSLWRLAEEGVSFQNFYCPLWGVSTTDGEYAHLTGLIPKVNTWSLWQSSENRMAFTLGNQLRDRGYTTLAYHDHQYDYYHRDLSHPNLGYTYKGVGGGLDLTPAWPESDLEMMERTVDDYIDSRPFHVYYMTVSGHIAYDFRHNDMAKKHEAEVSGLPYSQGARAYAACTVELDRALGYLMGRLEEAGIADDTVIALTADHYPYGLSRGQMAELAGAPVEGMELYHNAFYLWSGDMGPLEGLTVDKVCTTQDILPTLSNLMGLDYDSRLLVGNDIFSEAQGLVIFADYSWMTDRGRYDSGTGRFTPAPGASREGEDAYVQSIHRRVAQLYRASAMVLDNDYYAAVLPQ